MCILYWPHLPVSLVIIISVHTIMVSTFQFFVSASARIFSVKHNEYLDEDGHRMVENFPLSHAPLEKEPNFKLREEDPKFFKTEVGYNPVKEWEEPLPTFSASAEPELSIDPAKIRLYQQVHDMQVKVLEAFGIDACREYEEGKVEHVLEACRLRIKSAPCAKSN